MSVLYKMLQPRDAHLQDIIGINPKGPEAHGALLINASEKRVLATMSSAILPAVPGILLEMIHPNCDLIQRT